MNFSTYDTIIAQLKYEINRCRLALLSIKDIYMYIEMFQDPRFVKVKESY